MPPFIPLPPPHVRAEMAASFWARVDRSGDGCWLWTGLRSRKGYGRFCLNAKDVPAHRFAYALSREADPEALCVCHTCDNPPCVRPDHLWLGTVGDNTRDMWAKGRGQIKCMGRRFTPGHRTDPRHQPCNRGSDNPLAKLTEERVRDLRARSAAGERTTDLAREAGVSRHTLSAVITRRSWRHV